MSLDAGSPAARDTLAEARALVRQGDLLAAYEVARRGVEAAPDDLALRHQAVLALARSGAVETAAREFARLGLEGEPHGEVRALAARLSKDRALTAAGASRVAALREAATAYAAIASGGSDYYPLINAATLHRLAGDEDAAGSAARQVLDALKALGATDPGNAYEHFYRLATRAEAELVCGRVDAARAALEASVEHGFDDLSARATTRRQLRLLATHLEMDADALLEPLAPPATLHFTGHMISPPDSPGRLPSARAAELEARVKAELDQLAPAAGFGSLACGTDILFAEALVDRGAELNVVLPFDEDEFIRLSVARGGDEWVARYHAVRDRATTVRYVARDAYLGDDVLFALCAEQAMGLAALRARYLDGAAVQMAVWDGRPPAAPAGTAVDVERWRELGAPQRVIDIREWSELPVEAEGAAAERDRGRRPAGMIFGDIKGFSKLSDAQIPGFVDAILRALADVIERHQEGLMLRNTWGDGLLLVYRSPARAGIAALALQRAMSKVRLGDFGLPADMAMRIGGHYGPVYAAPDPVLHHENVYGAHVSRAARVEPAAAPGSVYATEAFAGAALALDPSAGIEADYVGVTPAAKNYGELAMYLLRETPSV